MPDVGICRDQERDRKELNCVGARGRGVVRVEDNASLVNLTLLESDVQFVHQVGKVDAICPETVITLMGLLFGYWHSTLMNPIRLTRTTRMCLLRFLTWLQINTGDSRQIVVIAEVPDITPHKHAPLSWHGSRRLAIVTYFVPQPARRCAICCMYPFCGTGS